MTRMHTRLLTLVAAAILFAVPVSAHHGTNARSRVVWLFRRPMGGQ